ncbi:MAG: DUF4129 domain-containing protein [Thermoplasmata archaeon]|nr:MAG: DUF4129 domain-containing protein [Thermoplasmata archaeon]
MNKIVSWLALILVVSSIIPIASYIALAPHPFTDDSSFEDFDYNEASYDTEDSHPESAEIIEEEDAPYYPDFPELPAPPAPGSPFYAVASPPPSYVNDGDPATRASRIKVNTSTVIAIDSPKHMDFVTLGQDFILSGGLYEDNNSNGQNDTGDLPVQNALLHIRWAYSLTYVDVMTDLNGRFSISIPNDNTNLDPVAHPLKIEFWGQWTINGSAYFEIPRYNITTNIPGYDDDGDMADRTSDGVDNDGDWKGWDGTNWNDDLNHNGQPDFNYDGVEGNDDDGNNGIDEETLNGVDDDSDGWVDEDCKGGDANGDQDGFYDPEPHIDEDDEGIDEEGVPNGMDDDGDTLIDEDCVLPFIPRQNSSTEIMLIIQHRTEISLSAKSVTTGRAQIGDKVALSGQLRAPDKPGQPPVAGKWIILKFHDHIIDYEKTDILGKFSYDYFIPSDIDGDKIEIGRRKFTALFDANYKPDNTSYYKTSEKDAYISIIRESEIEITNTLKFVYLQDEVTVMGKVTDETGDPLLFNFIGDDSVPVTIEPQQYKIMLEWGFNNDAYEGPFPGFLNSDGTFEITFTMESPFQKPQEITAKVSFEDKTNKYYKPSNDEDYFEVRGHSKLVDFEPVKGFHRGETAIIRGKLIQEDGSFKNGLAGAVLQARWGPAGPWINLTETRAGGYFTYSRDIEMDHQLGPIVVYFRFDTTDYMDGESYIDGFEPSEPFAHRTYYVIAQPTITMQSANIVKGETVVLTGKLIDDAGNPMPDQWVELYFSGKPIVNTDTGEWDPPEPKLTAIPTDSTGTFNYEYELVDTFDVGVAYGAALFKGFNPPYNASNAYDEAKTHNIIFNVSAKTTIIINREESKELFEHGLERGKDFTVKGEVRETYKGATLAKKVQPQHGEKLKVEVYLRSIDVSNASAVYAGDGTIGKLGTYNVLAKVPSTIEISEYVEMTLVFPGTNFYQFSSNSSTHLLWGNVFFDRAEIFQSFPDKDEETGRPAVYEANFDRRSDTYKEPWVIRVPIYEDIQGRQPPPVANATVLLNISGLYFINTTVSMTNKDGVAVFEFTSPPKDKDYPDRIKLLYKEKEAYDLEVTITFVGKPGLRSASTSFNMTYYPTPPPKAQGLLERYGTYISILVIITIIFVVFMIVFSSWYIKQQRLRGLKRIIKRAADQLIAGDQYRATIYKSYKKLSAHLRRYGYLRREAETFREFETAIKQALPIDRPSMHRFLDLLEEARYSSHKIGETQRHAAIANLRNIEGSLSQIIIDEEAAMRALRKLEEEEAAMAAAETEIIVKPGAEEGTITAGAAPGPAAPPQIPPGGAGGPPPKLPPGGT